MKVMVWRSWREVRIILMMNYMVCTDISHLLLSPILDRNLKQRNIFLSLLSTSSYQHYTTSSYNNKPSETFHSPFYFHSLLSSLKSFLYFCNLEILEIRLKTDTSGWWWVAQQNRVTPSPFNFRLLTFDLDLDCDKIQTWAPANTFGKISL